MLAEDVEPRICRDARGRGASHFVGRRGDVEPRNNNNNKTLSLAFSTYATTLSLAFPTYARTLSLAIFNLLLVLRDIPRPDIPQPGELYALVQPMLSSRTHRWSRDVRTVAVRGSLGMGILALLSQLLRFPDAGPPCRRHKEICTKQME